MQFLRGYLLRSKFQFCSVLAVFSVLIASSACYDNRQILWSRHGEFEWRHGPRTVVARHLGEIEFADNDEDVLRVSGDGYLFIQESGLLDSRSVEFTRHPDGSVGRRFVVNGEETAVDKDARAWMARMLPEILRQTGINASERAARILDRQGFEALFAEVRLMSRDTDRLRYLQKAIESGRLTEEQMLRIVRDMATLFFVSDSRKSTVLSGWAPEYCEVELLDGLLKAGETIRAGSIRARFALSLIELHCGSAEKMGMILSSVKRIGSDSTRRRCLEPPRTVCPARITFEKHSSLLCTVSVRTVTSRACCARSSRRLPEVRPHRVLPGGPSWPINSDLMK